jgi:hypothetical protein
VLARVALLVLAAAPVLALGCQTLTAPELRGLGAGPSNPIAIRAGTYRIDWVGNDDDAPRDGCLLGLAIEGTAPNEVRPGLVLDPRSPRLTYQAVPAGGSVTGQSEPVGLAQGFYLIRAEGSCAWQVRLTSVPPTPRR